MSLVLALAACASSSDKIQPSYVSPIQYHDYSCRQIRSELMRVAHKVNEISGVQDKNASNDAWATGIGLVLFWPSLFFISQDDQHVQLAELKGQYDALEQAAVQKNCDVAKEISEAKKMQAKRVQSQKSDRFEKDSKLNGE